MKKTPIVAIIALACSGLSPLQGGKAGAAEGLSKRPTDGQLAQRMAQRSNPLAKHRQLAPVAPDSLQQRKSGKELGGLLQRSTILAYDGVWTLVPRGAVLHVPPQFQNRLSQPPTGKLLAWKDFYARNRGWIFTQPVAIADARGERPLAEEVIENHRRLGRVVVAVLHNGPISVKAPRSPENQ